MSGQADVKSINAISKCISDTGHILGLFDEKVTERVRKAEDLADTARKEEEISRGMLTAAKAAETAATAAFVAADAYLASVTIAAVENPAMLLKIPAATEAVRQTKEALDIAKRHRELMERRYEMAQQCLNLADENFKELSMQLHGALMKIKATAANQTARLGEAYRTLTGYSAEQPAAVSAYGVWRSFSPTEKTPATPSDVLQRLNPNKQVCTGLLTELCKEDGGFMAMVAAYRKDGSDPDKRSGIELKIRKNMAGRLAEEIVKGALEPFGESVDTQSRTDLEDGAYTKIDLVVKNLKVPLILGKGERMAAREGADLAVEVKAGKSDYLRGQKSHLIFQASGHSGFGLSCTVCTRDIKDLSEESEEELRKKLREAGSPILGMLPRKEELDGICIDFVFGEKKNV